MSDFLLIDTSFWIALFDERHASHAPCVDKRIYLDGLTIVVPWPILYETLRTRFVRRPIWVQQLSDTLCQENVEFVDDTPYRSRAYDECIELTLNQGRPMSMVDVLCRLLIVAPTLRIDYLLTTNSADFYDVCTLHRVEML